MVHDNPNGSRILRAKYQHHEQGKVHTRPSISQLHLEYKAQLYHPEVDYVAPQHVESMFASD